MQQILDQIVFLVGDELFLRQVVVWLAAISTFVLIVGAALIVSSYVDPVRKRVGELAGDTTQSESMLLKAATSLGPVAAFVLPRDELERHKVMAQLFHAGFRSATALQVFYFVKTLLMLVLPMVVIAGSRMIPNMNAGNVVLYAFMASGIGMLGPNMVLHRMAEHRKRALTNAFPDALDLLVVCVESGLGLAAAIQRVADELEVSHPELAAELSLVNAEIRVGVPVRMP